MRSKRLVRFLNIFLFVFLLSYPALGFIGWVTFCKDGKVYRCRDDGNPELLYSGSGTAQHSIWSVDGQIIFFHKQGGEIWAMNNDGTNPRMIFQGKLQLTPVKLEWFPRISCYCPQPGCLLYLGDGDLDGEKFYKIDLSGKSTLIHTDTRKFIGEIAIDNSGTRMVARTVLELFKVPVGGASVKYVDYCNSCISPDGNYITRNNNAVSFVLYNWNGGTYKTLYPPTGKQFDNQSFAVNSNDYIAYWLHNNTTPYGGIVKVSDNTHYQVGNMVMLNPSLFVGALPGAVRTIPAIIRERVLPVSYTLSKGSWVSFDLKGRLASPASMGNGRATDGGMYVYEGISGGKMVSGKRSPISHFR